VAPVGPLGLEVGQRARRTQTVTTREIELYAQVTGDRNPLHFDVGTSRRGPASAGSWPRAASRPAC
jgi:acyl dehydratase